MKCESIQQFAIVQGDSASQFEEQLNARIRELASKSPSVKFDGLTAYISYTETNRIPENIADQYELEGVCFRCGDCPHYEPILKADGTVDGRITYGECQFAHMGRTYRDSRACELLFTQIKNGGIKLCLAK